jgi:hypothetical protein
MMAFLILWATATLPNELLLCTVCSLRRDSEGDAAVVRSEMDTTYFIYIYPTAWLETPKLTNSRWGPPPVVKGGHWEGPTLGQPPTMSTRRS